MRQLPSNMNLFVLPNNHNQTFREQKKLFLILYFSLSYIAECPTRPECFKRIPPLDAAAATLPFRSITIAPTVSNRSLSLTSS